LQDILAFEVEKNPFLGPTKKQAVVFHKVTFVCKKSEMVVLLWIHSSRQVGCMLENFQII